MVVVIGFAQTTNHTHIPKDAIFYNARWQGVATASKAAYYRVLIVDNRGAKMFYDYYITGQLRAEKHYISINRQDDKLTKLEGVCRTFYKSGTVESVMQYKNGVANGRALSFFPSGEVGMKLNYRNGVLDGPCYAYNEQGRVEYTTIWRDGSRISDSKGGKDYYINKVTNEDEFCERYRARESVIMVQSRQVNTSNADNKKIEKREAPASKVTSSIKKDESQQAKKASVPQQIVSKEMTEEERLIAEVKYPDAPVVVTESSKGNSPKKGRVRTTSIPDECLFPFPYLCHLLLDDTERLKDMPSLVALSKVFALKDSQTINGYSTQKEIIFHHNMYYDEQTGQDKVVGKQPRQIGYLGTFVDNQLILERINLFTWSSDEMLSFARQAIKAGYHVLGGGDYQSLDGNFILEPKSSKVSDDGSRSVLITFTHQPNLYGGLYHIQMDVR